LADISQLLIFFISILGILVGSFLNALVWRMHKRIPIGGTERSQCTYCQHQLSWYDLVPIISWLTLKGKCRYCHKSISIQYPLVELTNAIIWVFSYYLLQPDSTSGYLVLLLWLVTVSVMLALAVYDIRWMELPDRLVIVFTSLAILIVFLQIFNTDKTSISQVIDPILGMIFIAGLFYFLYSISNEKWIGGGDVKFAVGMGLILGLQGSIIGLFLASLIGSIFGLGTIWILKKDKKSLIPFGPFLIAATYIVFHFETPIITWYMTNLL